MTRGGVVGAGSVGRIRSDVRSAFYGDLVGTNAVGGIKAVSGLAESDNPPYFFLPSAESLDGEKSVYAKFKVREYLFCLQGVLECEKWVNTYDAMSATFDALRDVEV